MTPSSLRQRLTELQDALYAMNHAHKLKARITAALAEGKS